MIVPVKVIVAAGFAPREAESVAGENVCSLSIRDDTAISLLLSVPMSGSLVGKLSEFNGRGGSSRIR
jgi:hypothetical protein